MSRPTNSQALKEAYAQAKSDVIVYNTLEVLQGDPPVSAQKALDVAILMDASGSMGTPIQQIINIFPSLLSGLQEQYSIVRFGIMSYTTTESITILQDFTTDEQLVIDALDGITTGGSHEDGFGCTQVACDDMEWFPTTASRYRVVYLITDEDSNNGVENAEQLALDALAAREATFILGSVYNRVENYGNLIDDTGGSMVDFGGDEEQILEDTIVAIEGAAPPIEVVDPVYIIQAVEALDLPLELGGTPVTFEPVGFTMSLPGQNDQGVQDIGIAIDNVDGRILEFVQSIAVKGLPIVIRYRPYLSTDLSQPQMTPPLELVLAGVKVTDDQLSGRATFADIVNLKFLDRERYSAKRFPSLNNS